MPITTVWRLFWSLPRHPGQPQALDVNTEEKGKFLSIDVGGTNLRVGFVELIGEPDGGITVVN